MRTHSDAVLASVCLQVGDRAGFGSYTFRLDGTLKRYTHPVSHKRADLP